MDLADGKRCELACVDCAGLICSLAARRGRDMARSECTDSQACGARRQVANLALVVYFSDTQCASTALYDALFRCDARLECSAMERGYAFVKRRFVAINDRRAVKKKIGSFCRFFHVVCLAYARIMLECYPQEIKLVCANLIQKCYLNR